MKQKIWIRLGMTIWIDPKDLGDREKVMEAIRNGEIDGESYVPCADNYDFIPEEMIHDNEVYLDVEGRICEREDAAGA